MALEVISKTPIMLRTQVQDMLTMTDTTLKKYLQKECKHKDEILSKIISMRDEAKHDGNKHRYDELSWLYSVVKGTEVLCP